MKVECAHFYGTQYKAIWQYQPKLVVPRFPKKYPSIFSLDLLNKRRPDARPGPARLLLNTARGPSGLEKSGNLITLCKQESSQNVLPLYQVRANLAHFKTALQTGWAKFCKKNGHEDLSVPFEIRTWSCICICTQFLFLLKFTMQ